jgi:hypothetical protein
VLASHLAIRFRARARGTALLVRQEPLACATAVGLVAGACVFAYARARSVESCLGVAMLSAALVWLAHGTRADERFLRAAGAPYRRVYAAEYAVASLPASLLLLASPFPSTAAAPFVAVLAALTPAGTLRAAGRTSRGSAAVRVPGPADAFEWKAGLRGSAPGVLVVYALCGLLARFPAMAMLGIAVLAWMAAAVYQEGEGWPMLEALGRAPAPFLRRKLAHALGHWMVLAGPLALLVLIAHTALWAVLAAVLAGCGAIVAGAVLLKYALYHEGRPPSATGLLGVIAITVSVAVPPVAIFLLHRLWRMAVRNLDPYLYAFD